MGELLNSGLLNMASLMISLVVLLVGLVIWFFVNRASSRTNEQIELLEEDIRNKEKELYDLKHELIASQIKLENAEKAAKDAQMQSNEDNRKIMRLEAELKDQKK